MLLTIGLSVFERDPDPLVSYRWSINTSEFLISLVVGLCLTANGLWYALVLLVKKRNKCEGEADSSPEK